ncbi:hypothetical protein [Streptomyces gobitricini]|uniref:Uncharacterized protein n=1 Tax=Streptomyces gobitricini TaxID=68211 RepID=A0ABN3LCG6_9ACTN
MDAHRLVRTGPSRRWSPPPCPGGPVAAATATGDPSATGGEATAPVSSPTPSPTTPAATSGAADGSRVGLTDGRPVGVTVKQGHAVVPAEAHVRQGAAHGTDTWP